MELFLHLQFRRFHTDVHISSFSWKVRYWRHWHCVATGTGADLPSLPPGQARRLCLVSLGLASLAAGCPCRDSVGTRGPVVWTEAADLASLILHAGQTSCLDNRWIRFFCLCSLDRLTWLQVDRREGPETSRSAMELFFQGPSANGKLSRRDSCSLFQLS